jgi:hypothetical protein
MKRTLITICVLLFGAALLGLAARRTDAQTGIIGKIAAAKTAADHEAVAVEFEQEAKDLEAKAALHAAMARHYGMDQYAHQRKPSLKSHCEELTASLRRAAEQAKEMAKLHHGMAQKAEE